MRFPAHHLARAAAVDGQAHQLARGVVRLTSTLAHISISGDVLSVQNSFVSGEEVFPMSFQVEVEREQDGRWIAEVPDLPGVLVYGEDRASAIARAQALAARVIAERREREGKQYLKGRARRGSREQYDAALAEMPDVDPDPYDRLAEACSHLDRDEEHALAEEGLAADFDAWPEYSTADGGSEQLSQVTARLDQIYATEDSSLDADFRRAQPVAGACRGTGPPVGGSSRESGRRPLLARGESAVARVRINSETASSELAVLIALCCQAQPAHHLARAAAVDGQAHQRARGVAHLPPAALRVLGEGVRLRLGGSGGGGWLGCAHGDLQSS